MEKQADFHATLWEATVAKPHVALYIDIMMDEPMSHSFHFVPIYSQASFDMLFYVPLIPCCIRFYFLAIWELKAKHLTLPEQITLIGTLKSNTTWNLVSLRQCQIQITKQYKFH